MFSTYTNTHLVLIESLLAPLNSCCNAIPQTCLHLQQGSIPLMETFKALLLHLEKCKSTFRNGDRHRKVTTYWNKGIC